MQLGGSYNVANPMKTMLNLDLLIIGFAACCFCSRSSFMFCLQRVDFPGCFDEWIGGWEGAGLDVPLISKLIRR